MGRASKSNATQSHPSRVRLRWFMSRATGDRVPTRFSPPSNACMLFLFLPRSFDNRFSAEKSRDVSYFQPTRITREIPRPFRVGSIKSHAVAVETKQQPKHLHRNDGT